METRLRIVTIIAVVATLAAVIEGVVLVKLSSRTAPGVAETSATDTTSAVGGDVQDVAVASVKSAGTETAPAAPEAEGKTAAVADASPTIDSADTQDAAAPEPGVDEAPSEELLSDEEKAAKRAAEDKARMTQAMVLMAETSVNKMLDGLKLTEAQREQAAEIRERLCGIMLSMMVGPQERAEALNQKATEMRESGRFTDEQIQQTLASEYNALFQETLDGMTEMTAALDDLTPIFDGGQMEALNQMKIQMERSREMTKKMFEQMRRATEQSNGEPEGPGQ
ncbi:MAG: hypothetical protein JXL80_16645 [Planctomycetes bacterium]|nr:hypothetical protein [Planctomycetota bacterium]